MRIENHLVVDHPDITPLYGELVEIFDHLHNLIPEHSHEQIAIYLRKEYPQIYKLKNLLESMLVGQQTTRNYERLGDAEKKEELKRVKLKVVREAKEAKKDRAD